MVRQKPYESPFPVSIKMLRQIDDLAARNLHDNAIWPSQMDSVRMRILIHRHYLILIIRLISHSSWFSSYNILNGYSIFFNDAKFSGAII